MRTQEARNNIFKLIFCLRNIQEKKEKSELIFELEKEFKFADRGNFFRISRKQKINLKNIISGFLDVHRP